MICRKLYRSSQRCLCQSNARQKVAMGVSSATADVGFRTQPCPCSLAHWMTSASHSIMLLASAHQNLDGTKRDTMNCY
jgi:hypothetical protein